VNSASTKFSTSCYQCSSYTFCVCVCFAQGKVNLWFVRLVEGQKIVTT
jgi:hypothetical protein